MANKQQKIEELMLVVKRAISNNSTYDVDYDHVQACSDDIDHIAEEVAEKIVNDMEWKDAIIKSLQEDYQKLEKENKRLKKAFEDYVCKDETEQHNTKVRLNPNQKTG